MAKNTRNYPKKSEEDLKETASKLKRKIRRLEATIRKLKEENDSLQRAWQKTEKFLQQSLEDIPLEELLKHNKLPKKATRQKKQEEKEDIREKMQRWLQEKKKNEVD